MCGGLLPRVQYRHSHIVMNRRRFFFTPLKKERDVFQCLGTTPGVCQSGGGPSISQMVERMRAVDVFFFFNMT